MELSIADAAGGSVRPGPGGEAPLGRLGPLEVRLAEDADDVARAQALRHRLFRAGRGGSAAGPWDEGAREKGARDVDPFDAICDHLLVKDRAEGAVVATCRLLRREVAEAGFGFYSQGEFDLGPLLAAHPRARFLELGRSCVLASHRAKRAVELLWHGAWAYALRHGSEVMFGCASLPGVDPDRLALPLAFLHRHARAEPGWRVRALPGRGVAMDRRPADAPDSRAALRALPPLLKGYLRLGARVSEDAVIDPDFGTTDVLVLLRVAQIDPRYLAHFGPSAERHGALPPAPVPASRSDGFRTRGS